MRWRAPAGLAALGLALALGACGGGGATAPGATTAATIPGGRRGAPLDLTLPALDGGELTLASLRGKLVVLHVFTTWSMEAQADLPALGEADLAPDVVVVGIALDPEGRTLVAPWRNGADAHYLITLADGAVVGGSSALGRVTTVPTTLVLDRRGRVVARTERPLADGELAALLAAARAEP